MEIYTNNSNNLSVIDLFCGIGGLSFGLKKAGLKISAGIDFDTDCKLAYEANVKAEFIGTDISKIQGKDIEEAYWIKEDIKVLVGCAPCQPFSSHSNKVRNKEGTKKWKLLYEFQRLINETEPSIVSMENVPNLSNKEVFKDFVEFLVKSGYNVSHSNVYCPDYGIPQKRRRLVLLASKLGEIKLIDPIYDPSNYRTTKDAIGNLAPVEAGVVYDKDPLHRTTKLSELNLERIKASRPNGTWEDWEERLRLACHKKKSGNTYKSVYGRMSWDQPSPTITTQFYNYGTGRFGHPEQNRALTVREGALLQTFPSDYIFSKPDDDISISKLGIHIGNAVPVDLGYIIGLSIKNHLNNIKNE